MRRHSVIARLGPTDRTRVPLQIPGSAVTQIHFVDGDWRLGFGLGQIVEQLAARGVLPSDTGLDLSLVAATVTAADTRISRASESQDTWTREIDLYLPVRDPQLWTAAAPLLKRMLDFLSGDRWRIFFRPRHRDYQRLIRVEPGPPSNFAGACLLSGGLDSFTGAIDLLSAQQKLIFVSHYWDASTSSQPACVQRLASVYGDMNSRHVRARVGFPDDLVAGSAPEKTQRARSFLFFALATLAVSGLDGNTTIYVPENGLISLNVPLDPLRVGAWSTRTTHPFFIARWQELLRLLAIAASVINPYRFKTKGEMLSECADRKLLKASFTDTISCSSVTKARWKKRPPGHCGYCVPCLIRRASVVHAFGKDPTIYTIPSLSATTLNARAPEGEHVRSFQIMYRRLSKRADLARILVHKTGPLYDYPKTDLDEYADVFLRGIREVGKIVKAVTVRPS